MLKYIFFLLILSISTPCFCVATQLSSVTSNTISTEKKQDKVLKKQAFLQKFKSKRFPIFGVISVIASVLGTTILFPLYDYAERHPWISTTGLILNLLGIGLGIVGLIVGEFALWSLLGVGLVPLIIFLLLAINGTGSC
jgi:hypothetical protein